MTTKCQREKFETMQKAFEQIAERLSANKKDQSCSIEHCKKCDCFHYFTVENYK